MCHADYDAIWKITGCLWKNLYIYMVFEHQIEMMYLQFIH